MTREVTMTEEKIKAWLDDFSIEMEHRYILDYMGRRMYNASCPGIRCHDVANVYAEFLAWVQSEDSSIDFFDLINTMGTAEWDQLGRDYIVYWPQLSTYE